MTGYVVFFDAAYPKRVWARLWGYQGWKRGPSRYSDRKLCG